MAVPFVALPPIITALIDADCTDNGINSTDVSGIRPYIQPSLYQCPTSGFSMLTIIGQYFYGANIGILHDVCDSWNVINFEQIHCVMNAVNIAGMALPPVAEVIVSSNGGASHSTSIYTIQYGKCQNMHVCQT